MRWELVCERGRQVWQYVSGKPLPDIAYDKKNHNSGDKVYRRQALAHYKPLTLPANAQAKYDLPAFPAASLASQCLQANLSAVHYYAHLQSDDGHWPGDYGGPMFLLPGALIVCYVTGVLQSWPQAKRDEMVKYLLNHQNDDGGWGLHIEAPSTQFGTVMNYIALRLLGLLAQHPALVKPREFIRRQGGGYMAPSWCKFWLCVFNLMSWDGYNSVFPEFWLLPETIPFHPWRWWCHCRMVYLPMAYLYAVRWQAPEDSLIHELRAELYVEPYDSIEWSKHRDDIARIDLYTPPTRLLQALNFLANTYERIRIPALRRRAARFMLAYIEAEDAQTSSIDIGPVNKFVNMLAVYTAHGSADERYRRHVERVDDYLWLAEDGMKCQGYNGSQLWDTAFAVQAIVESGVARVFERTVRSAYRYVDISQVQEDVQDRVQFYRHLSKGGWPFSTLDHGWPITDCTSEGLKATLAIHDFLSVLPAPQPTDVLIGQSRLEDAVNCLLTFQNDDGGWATYENKRAGGWMEWLNPAEVFAGIMVDYSYCECTSATVQALARFRSRYPTLRRVEIDSSIARGVEFLKRIQRDDGSWYGSWAVCFTYGAWFGVEGLLAGGESADSECVVRACRWLVGTQKADGGWGESYESCVLKRYVEHERSQVVNTAWALLALMKGGWTADDGVIERGIRLLLSRQTSQGDWEQESISGVFNGNCFSDDTRLLTDRGFLFLHQVMWRWQELRFACYNPTTQQLEYHHASDFICKPHGRHAMVSFTGVSEQPRWTADAQDYGRPHADAEDEDEAERSHGISLLVTADHDMFVQRGRQVQGQDVVEWRQTGGKEEPHARLKAATLVSADPQECIRPITCIRGGVEADLPQLESLETQKPAETEQWRTLPFVDALRLTSEEQVHAFLELYGFWLGDGSLEYQLDNGAYNAVCFCLRKAADIDWVRQQLAKAGISREQLCDYQLDQLNIRRTLVLSQRWFHYFDAAYGVSHTESDVHKSDPSQSAKCFMPWVLTRLSSQQVGLVIDGFHRAAGVWTEQRVTSGSEKSLTSHAVRRINTSSTQVRDELMVACLHAGYSPTFRLHHDQGSIRNYTSADGQVHSVKKVQRLSSEVQAHYTAVRATKDCWTVSCAQKEAVLHCASEVTEVTDYDGPVWCVRVPHGLLVAQRAQCNSDGVVTQASRPVVVPNCMITYTNYRNIFPIWALGRYVNWCRARQQQREHR